MSESKDKVFFREIFYFCTINHQKTIAMKKQIIIVLLLLVSIAMPVAAQKTDKNVEERVQLARDRYAVGLENISINKQYERDEVPAVNYTTVTRQQNWAGSGMTIDKMEFYYNEIEDDMEPYPLGYKLVIMRRNYNIGSFEALEEYLYDDDEHPLFWFTRYNDYGQIVELRGYFDTDGSLIRTICKTKDDNGKMTTCDLNDDFEGRFNLAKSNFKRFKKAFQSLYDVEYSY